ncbi:MULTISPECIES: AraC family transcriptional regulator [Bacteroidota]|uniref:AraC family transcriptional regulator n=1 Tax=Bacteroidota TaxID=976 RepID=UPI001CBFF620|nr:MULTISPECIES: helix-turn-helix domain-containing protein [Bacteroidota]MBZ4190746.1 AraC family transcriptional regulator [Niabella beijingensis]UMQ40862.1 AraC family transcriptional regulator [Chryseobacterium sp. Y16C]
MEIPYILKLVTGFRKQKLSLNNLPEWSKFPLPFASERQVFTLPQFELLSQQLKNVPFFIDLVQLNVTEPAYIPFDISERQLYLYFMLKGSLLYMTEEHKPIIRTQANTFLMSYYDTGRYFAYAEKGVHICLVVSILPEWIESMYHNYPNLQYILHRFKNDTRPYDTMYQCRMDRKIHRWLYKIYSYSQNNIGALDGNLRKYISYLLEYYDSVLEQQKSDLAYKIKTHIQEHYTDNALTVKSLSEYFFVTERTLLNIFKRQYRMSVQDFITDLRMTHALLLMEQGTGIKDVYMAVGYTNERPFRTALERYLKRK